VYDTADIDRLQGRGQTRKRYPLFPPNWSRSGTRLAPPIERKNRPKQAPTGRGG